MPNENTPDSTPAPDSLPDKAPDISADLADLLFDSPPRRPACLTSEQITAYVCSGHRSLRHGIHLMLCSDCRAECRALTEELRAFEAEYPDPAASRASDRAAVFLGWKPMRFVHLASVGAVSALVCGLWLAPERRREDRLPSPFGGGERGAAAQLPPVLPGPVLPGPAGPGTVSAPPPDGSAARGTSSQTSSAPAAGGSAQARPGSRKVAVVIGINRYSPVARLPDLKGAENDARRVAAALSAGGVQVYTLIPGMTEPTFGNIMQSLRAIGSSAQDDDLLFYFSGHGLSDGTTGYFMPADATDDPGTTGISLPMISAALGRSARFNSLVLIADVCKVAVDGRSAKFVDNLNRQSDRWLVMTAAGAGESAYEDPKFLPPDSMQTIPEQNEWHGRFSYYLLSGRYAVGTANGRLIAAADKNGDGQVTWAEAFGYAKELTIRRSHLHARGADGSLLLMGPQMSASDPRLANEPSLLAVRPNPGSAKMTIEPVQIQLPSRDPSGVFVLYRDLVDGAAGLPFEPWAWMWGNQQGTVIAPDLVNQMMRVDIAAPGGPLGSGTCVRWHVDWQGAVAGQSWNAAWAGLGWFAVPDAPPWWAEDGNNIGRYFNLERPFKFQELRFDARSPVPGTRLLAKIGPLARDKNNRALQLGDSLAWPIVSQSLELDQKWREFVVRLVPFEVQPHVCAENRLTSGTCQICGSSAGIQKLNNLERICSIAFVIERYPRGRNPGQPNPNQPVDIELDNIRFQ